MVRTLIEGAPYDGSRAARDLGLDYTPIETTMRRTISWYIEQRTHPAAATGIHRFGRRCAEPALTPTVSAPAASDRRPLQPRPAWEDDGEGLGGAA